MFIDALKSPVAFTAVVTAASVVCSVLATTMAMVLAGYGDFLFAYGLAAGMPAVAAPLTVYPLVRANRELKMAQAELQRLALTDVLTGLPNRRAFFEQAERLFRRATEASKPLAAMMVDVDRFKAINDAHGHIVGDAILAAVGRTIQDTIADYGASDWMVARMGGEEFAILVVGLTPTSVARLVERIGRDVRGVDYRYGSEAIPATVSIGVSIRQDGAEVDAVLKAADDASYVAKRAGRDRWSFAGDAPAWTHESLLAAAEPHTAAMRRYS